MKLLDDAVQTETRMHQQTKYAHAERKSSDRLATQGRICCPYEKALFHVETRVNGYCFALPRLVVIKQPLGSIVPGKTKLCVRQMA